MPFYEYQCKSCGHALEAMQKINDAPLKKCPHCGKSQLTRLMSAPVFRLKGGGWYETDFKGDQDNKKNLADRPESDAAKGRYETGRGCEGRYHYQRRRPARKLPPRMRRPRMRRSPQRKRRRRNLPKSRRVPEFPSAALQRPPLRRAAAGAREGQCQEAPEKGGPQGERAALGAAQAPGAACEPG